MGKTVESVKEVVEQDVADNLEKVHVVRQEKTTYIRSTYSWATQYAKEKYEEQRTIPIPEDTPVNVVYAYQLLTQADLCHMVIFNANSQGVMEDDEMLEIMQGTGKVLKKVIPYMKEAKKKDLEIYEDMVSIYKRLKRELVEYGIVK